MRLSISKIKLFKSCRRAYELRYIEGLTPVDTAAPLQSGLWYHERIEDLYRTGEVDISDLSKEAAMAMAYKKYIYPRFKVSATEKWVERSLSTGDTLIGRVDGMAEDGRIVEHKTTSLDITEEYEYDLQWDEQILAYMLMTGAREVWYTVCRKPNIRQKRGETDDGFFVRMVRWFDEDTDSKIRLMLISRTDEEVERFSEEVERMAVEMRTDNFYRNAGYCKSWGRRCEYAPVCLNYDPAQTYMGFVKE